MCTWCNTQHAHVQQNDLKANLKSITTNMNIYRIADGAGSAASITNAIVGAEATSKKASKQCRDEQIHKPRKKERRKFVLLLPPDVLLNMAFSSSAFVTVRVPLRGATQKFSL